MISVDSGKLAVLFTGWDVLSVSMASRWTCFGLAVLCVLHSVLPSTQILQEAKHKATSRTGLLFLMFFLIGLCITKEMLLWINKKGEMHPNFCCIPLISANDLLFKWEHRGHWVEKSHSSSLFKIPPSWLIIIPSAHHRSSATHRGEDEHSICALVPTHLWPLDTVPFHVISPYHTIWVSPLFPTQYLR